MTPARVLVEQAVARGQSLDWIVDNLHVEPSFVDEVLHRMDEAVGITDDAEPVAEDPDVEPWHYVRGRLFSSYFGPADPTVIDELVDAIVPSHSRRSRHWWAA